MVECGAELSEQVGLQDNFLFLLFSLVKGTTWEWQNLSFSVVHGWYVMFWSVKIVDFWILDFGQKINDKSLLNTVTKTI
jgi:hypothetical protein